MRQRPLLSEHVFDSALSVSYTPKILLTRNSEPTESGFTEFSTSEIIKENTNYHKENIKTKNKSKMWKLQ